MSNIVVTGGAGYLGGHLVNLLELDHTNEITVLDNYFYGHWHVIYGSYTALSHRVCFRNVDCNNLNKVAIDAIKNADYIFMLHALVGAPRCEINRNLACATNYDSVIKIALMAKKDCVIIYPDSNSGYGCVPDGVCDENTASNPLSLYAETKERAGKWLLNHHERTIVFKLATLFGPSPRMRFDLLVNNLVWDAYHKGKIELFEPNVRRNYCYVSDAARGMIYAKLNWQRMMGQLYNLGNDSINMTKGDLVREIQKIVPCEIVESNKYDSDKRDYLVSSAKLANKGFTADQTDLKTGIEKLVQYYKNLPQHPKLLQNAIACMTNQP